MVHPRPAPVTLMNSLLVSTGVVALAEIGDRTQLATAALAAKFDTMLPVVAGTTLGMMLADIPAVLVGHAAGHRISGRWVRWLAAAVSAALAAMTPLGMSPV